MPKGKGVVGHALYFELRKGSATQQIFFTQAQFDPKSERIVPGAMLARVLSPKSPRRKWRSKKINMPDITVNTGTRSVAAIEDLNNAKKAVTPMLEAITKEVRMTLDTGWGLTGAPVVVEMTEADLEAIRIGKAPEALIRRTNNARIDCGFPEQLWDTAPIDAEELVAV